MQRKATICGICPGACGVEVEMNEGKLEKVHALKRHPLGMVCMRGKHASEVIYSPDRLEYPLKRAGRRGEGKFARVSWEEALDGIASEMQQLKSKHGPQSMAHHVGRGVFEEAFIEFFQSGGYNIASLRNTFLFPFGSPNCSGVGSLCYVSYGLLAPMSVFGLPVGRTSADFRNSEVIVVWGTNPVTNSPPALLPRLLAAQKNGAEIIAIDPMNCNIAKKANRWIPIRPGTDGALALGLLNIIIEQQLYDQEFVSNWTLGFDQLKKYVKNFTPERVQQVTGVSPDSLVLLANKIGHPRKVSFNMYTGLEYTNSGVQNLRAVFILWAITGNIDRPGGLLLWPEIESTGKVPEIEQPQGMPPVGADKYPLYTELTETAHFMELPRAVLKSDPYPVRGLIIQGSSILTSYPNPALWKNVFSSLELLVVIDRFRTADCYYADYILPATTYFENTSFQRYRGYLQLRKPIIKPLGEARSDFNILSALAQKLGYGNLYPRDEEDMVQWAFAHQPGLLAELEQHPEGIRSGAKLEKKYQKYASGDLRPDGKPGFPTPSGKLEIASTLLAKHGYEPLPVYAEPAEGPLGSPDLTSDFPLILNTGARLQSTFRSQHLNIPGLSKLQPRPQVLINPEDAASMSIQEGDRVIVSTLRGQVPFYAKVTGDQPAGGVEVNVGGGGPLGNKEWQEANTNLLTDHDNRDPISGFPVLKALLCEVTKAD